MKRSSEGTKRQGGKRKPAGSQANQELALLVAAVPRQMGHAARGCCDVAVLPFVEEGDLQNARRKFESHVLRTTQPILERFRFIGRGAARMMLGVHPAYLAELRVIVLLHMWERSGLVASSLIGTLSASAMIKHLVERMQESRTDYIPAESLTESLGAMFLWWYDECTRYAPEYLEADVLVVGAVDDGILDDIARLIWGLRHLAVTN